MANKIEWLQLPGYTAETWNPVTGCTKVSAGCQNCWAEKMAKRNAGRCGYPIQDPFKVTFHPDRMNIPNTWKKPRMVFVCSMSDLFHEDVPDSTIHQIIDVITDEQNSKHLFLILTKRAERMEMFFSAMHGETGWVPQNLWLGVTAETQASVDMRVPALLETPAAKRFVSCEPLLEEINLRDIFYDDSINILDALTGNTVKGAEIHPGTKLDWVIAGGESGPYARPCNPAWIRFLRTQCTAAKVPFFFKQWGTWKPVTNRIEAAENKWILSYSPTYDMDFIKVGKKQAGRVLDGVEHVEFPTVETGHCPVSEKKEV